MSVLLQRVSVLQRNHIPSEKTIMLRQSLSSNCIYNAKHPQSDQVEFEKCTFLQKLDRFYVVRNGNTASASHIKIVTFITKSLHATWEIYAILCCLMWPCSLLKSEATQRIKPQPVMLGFCKFLVSSDTRSWLHGAYARAVTCSGFLISSDTRWWSPSADACAVTRSGRRVTSWLQLELILIRITNYWILTIVSQPLPSQSLLPPCCQLLSQRLWRRSSLRLMKVKPLFFRPHRC